MIAGVDRWGPLSVLFCDALYYRSVDDSLLSVYSVGFTMKDVLTIGMDGCVVNKRPIITCTTGAS